MIKKIKFRYGLLIIMLFLLVINLQGITLIPIEVVIIGSQPLNLPTLSQESIKQLSFQELSQIYSDGELLKQINLNIPKCKCTHKYAVPYKRIYEMVLKKLRVNGEK